MSDLFQIITLVSAVFMTLLILIQSRGASLGAGFGSAGELFTERRGTDKSIYRLTIVMAVTFVGSLIAGILRG